MLLKRFAGQWFIFFVGHDIINEVVSSKGSGTRYLLMKGRKRLEQGRDVKGFRNWNRAELNINGTYLNVQDRFKTVQ